MSGISGAGAITKSGGLGKFPTGMIIKGGVLDSSRDTNHRGTTSTSFIQTGLAGTITTLKSSAESRLVFKLMRGMMYCQDGYTGQSTLCLTTSSTTSYASGDDLVSSTNQYYNYVNGATHQPKYEEIHYVAGSSLTPSNLTSYSAGQTLHYRYFMRSGSTSSTYYFVHADSHYTIEYQEIAL